MTCHSLIHLGCDKSSKNVPHHQIKFKSKYLKWNQNRVILKWKTSFMSELVPINQICTS